MFNVESSSDTSYNRINQFIRVQVRKQSPERSNRHTWTHINPVVNWNHEGFQTNLHTTKIAVIQHNKQHVVLELQQARPLVKEVSLPQEE